MRRIAIVLAASSLLAIVLTRGATHVPASLLPLGVGIAAVATALLVPERRRRPAAIAAAIVAGLAAAGVLLRPGLPQVHDPDHVWGVWAYARSVRAGHLLPMWTPWLGAGMPLLQFYGPASFVSSLPGVLLGLAPAEIWKLTLAQASVLASLSALAGARLLGASWSGAAIAACALAWAPWRLTVFHYRGAFGEAVAFASAPLVAASVLATLRAPSRRRSAWLAASVALLLLTHLITAFGLALVLVAVVAIDELASRRERLLPRAGATLLAAALALGATAAFWLPAVAESAATSLPLQTQENPYFVYEQHGLFAADLVERRGWDRLRPSLLRRDRAAGGEGEQMPFYLGAVLLALGVTAPWWSRSRATWGLAGGALLAATLALAPLADVMTHLPLVDRLQFPWRFLSTATVLAALATGIGASTLPRTRWAAALPLLLALDALPYLGASGWIPPYRGVTHWALNPGADPNAPFDLSRHAVPQAVEPSGVMRRVGDLYLPPDTTETPIELGWLAYVEWTTPAYYRGLLRTRAPEEFGEAGVSRYFLPDRERPIEIAAKPYATLGSEGAEIDAGAYDRSPGRVTLRPRVPAGGARLVVREQAFPGWRARVGGHDTPIATGALGFMTIELPEGEHEVELEYTRGTPARRAGSLISLISVLVGVRHLFAKRKGA